MREYKVICDCCGESVNVPKPFIRANVPVVTNEGIFEVEEYYPEGWFRLIDDKDVELTFCSKDCIKEKLNEN